MVACRTGAGSSCTLYCSSMPNLPRFGSASRSADLTACLAVTGTRSWRASMYRKASSLDTLVADSHRHLPMKRPIRSTPAAASTSLNSGARVAREDTALLLPAAEDAPSAAERAESSALEFYLVASASFVAELGFSCFIPTLYPRLQRLGARDPGSLLGLATSAYCAGQLAGNVLLGHLAHRLGVRIVLAGASLLQAAGTLLFLLCLLYTSPSPRDRTRSRMPSSA